MPAPATPAVTEDLGKELVVPETVPPVVLCASAVVRRSVRTELDRAGFRWKENRGWLRSDFVVWPTSMADRWALLDWVRRNQEDDDDA